MDEVRTVWHRRPDYGQIASGVRDPDIRHFCREEWASSFDGLLLNLEGRFVNPLLAEFAAVKPRQLRVAAEAGLRTPDTLITNNPECVAAFLEKHRGRVIHKALTVPKNHLMDTRQWTDDDRPALPGHRPFHQHRFASTSACGLPVHDGRRRQSRFQRLAAHRRKQVHHRHRRRQQRHHRQTIEHSGQCSGGELFRGSAPAPRWLAHR